MLQSIEGVYRDGKVELLEPAPMAEGRVIVTFLPDGPSEVGGHVMNESDAREMRWRLQSFAEDWDRPEMDVYDAPDAR